MSIRHPRSSQVKRSRQRPTVSLPYKLATDRARRTLTLLNTAVAGSDNSSKSTVAKKNNQPISRPKSKSGTIPIVGRGVSAASQPSGLKAMARRHHIIVKNLDSLTDADTINQHVKQTMGIELLHQPVEVKMKGRSKAFHLVVAEHESKKIFNRDGWPFGVKVDRFYMRRNQPTDKQ